MIERFQSELGKDPVLALQIHDISDRRKTGILVKHIRFRHRDSALLIQNLDQLHCDRAATKARKRIVVFFLLRVYHSIRCRLLFDLFAVNHIERYFMMVCYDHCHPHLLCQCDRLDRRDSVVTGDDRIHTIFTGLQDQCLIDSIAVFDPIRNRSICLRATSGKSLQQNIRCHYAINIVISDDPDLLSGIDLIPDDRSCQINIL